MPLIEVQALPQADDMDVAAVLLNLCEEAAKVLNVPAAAVRGVWRTIEPGRLVDGGSLVGSQPRASHPPVIRITALEGRPPQLIERLLQTLAEAAARGLGLSRGNVWIVCDVKPSGTLYTDGVIRRKKP